MGLEYVSISNGYVNVDKCWITFSYLYSKDMLISLGYVRICLGYVNVNKCWIPPLDNSWIS